MDEYQKNLNSEQINPDLIKQQLILGNEADANISYKALRGDIKIGYDTNKDVGSMEDSKTSVTVETDKINNFLVFLNKSYQMILIKRTLHST
ncbi:hypothetical protein [Ligilactobacillus salivarius]|uniref:hypothetical protein n=1 Tax=Ligilactobacillus salivarius TaxID=1624 RepID=UPI003F895F27